VAGVQRSVISVPQLTAAGLDADDVLRRRRNGRLHPYLRGIYLVGHAEPAPLSRETAALLALGPHALLSHDTAAHHRLGAREPAEVHVTVVGRRPRQREGIRRHLAPAMARTDWSLFEGLPMTRPARTLVDLAAEWEEERLDRLVAEALATRATAEREVRRALGRAGSGRGHRRLLALLDGGTGLTRSGGERALLRLLAAAGLPAPEVNVRLGAWEADFVWRERRLVVELDGAAGHSGARARDRDARKAAELELAGWRVIRITGRQLAERPEWVVATIAALLWAAPTAAEGRRD